MSKFLKLCPRLNASLLNQQQLLSNSVFPFITLSVRRFQWRRKFQRGREEWKKYGHVMNVYLTVITSQVHKLVQRSGGLHSCPSLHSSYHFLESEWRKTLPTSNYWLNQGVCDWGKRVTQALDLVSSSFPFIHPSSSIPSFLFCHLYLAFFHFFLSLLSFSTWEKSDGR